MRDRSIAARSTDCALPIDPSVALRCVLSTNRLRQSLKRAQHIHNMLWKSIPVYQHSLAKEHSMDSTCISWLSQFQTVSSQIMSGYEIMFGCVQKLQIVHLIPLKTINIVIYNKYSKPGSAGPVFIPNL